MNITHFFKIPNKLTLLRKRLETCVKSSGVPCTFVTTSCELVHGETEVKNNHKRIKNLTH